MTVRWRGGVNSPMHACETPPYTLPGEGIARDPAFFNTPTDKIAPPLVCAGLGILHHIFSLYELLSHFRAADGDRIDPLFIAQTFNC
jgi:hypothetical protein